MSRTLSFYLLCLVLLTSACNNASWRQDMTTSEITKRSERYSQKHQLELKYLRRQEDQQHRIVRLHVGYFTKQLLDVDSAREIVVDVMADLLRKINSDPRTRAGLHPYPFTAENVDLVIKADSFFGDFFEDEYVGRVVVSQGVVHYFGFGKKINTREHYSLAQQMIRDRQMETIRLADAQVSQEKAKWIASQKSSARIEPIVQVEQDTQPVSELRESTSPPQAQRVPADNALIDSVISGLIREELEAASNLVHKDAATETTATGLVATGRQSESEPVDVVGAARRMLEEPQSKGDVSLTAARRGASTLTPELSLAEERSEAMLERLVGNLDALADEAPELTYEVELELESLLDSVASAVDMDALLEAYDAGELEEVEVTPLLEDVPEIENAMREAELWSENADVWDSKPSELAETELAVVDDEVSFRAAPPLDMDGVQDMLAELDLDGEEVVQ